MLGDKRVLAAIPVKDVDRARDFYEGVLGLRFAGGPRDDGSLEYECGAGTGLFTYPTDENAGRSPATLAAWQVDDIRATAQALRDNNIILEEYDTPRLKTEDGIATLARGRTIWFKDPDGNILNAFERDQAPAATAQPLMPLTPIDRPQTERQADNLYPKSNRAPGPGW